jgi:ribonuclease HI
VYCDEAWCNAGVGASTILISPSGIKLIYAKQLQFTKETDKCTNNIVEYKVVLLGLQKFRAMGVQNCVIKMNSKVTVGQIEKECIARDSTLKKYLALIRRMLNYFIGFSVKHIDKNKNIKADELAKAAARKIALPLDVFFQTIEDSSVKTIESKTRMVNVIQGEDWWARIMAYLRHHYEPENNIELLRIKQKARAYQVIDNNLYKTSVSGPLLHCLSKDEGEELEAKIHSGVYGGHIGSRALATKIFRQGFYWLSIIEDDSKIIATCEACQKISPHSRAPS